MPGIMPDFPAQTLTLDLGPRSYPIYVGTDILGKFGTAFCYYNLGRQAVIISDENVAPLHASKLVRSLADTDIKTHIITVAAGESSKGMQVLQSIYDQLFDFNLERRDSIIALGGGVVGDLAGFVAATFKRGVNFVQVPTSLLAMVDSSIGGKTGINHPRGKNMIGAFYQPRLVFADTAVLGTLPARQLGCGLAETVKHAVIRDANFFSHLQKNAKNILNLQQELMADLVLRNCRIKSAVVSADEQEAGLRGILNYGHTIGHTLETVKTVHDYHHGEAVALGIVAANKLALQRKLIDTDSQQKIIQLLTAFNLPTSVNEKLPVDKLYHAMQQDKKVQTGKIKFVVPTSIGDCTFVDDFTEDQIKAAMKSLSA